MILQERLEYGKEDVLLDDRWMGTQTQDSHNFWRSLKHWQELKMKQGGGLSKWVVEGFFALMKRCSNCAVRSLMIIAACVKQVVGMSDQRQCFWNFLIRLHLRTTKTKAAWHNRMMIPNRLYWLKKQNCFYLKVASKFLVSLRIMVKIFQFTFTARPEPAWGWPWWIYLMGKQKHLTFTVLPLLYTEPEVKMYSFLSSEDTCMLLTATHLWESRCHVFSSQEK